MKKKIIWSVIAVVIVVAVVLGILYFTTDMFKTPEQLFYKKIADNVNFFGKTIYSDMLKEVKTKLEETKRHTGEITAKITSTDSSVKQIATALEKGKILYDIKTVGAEQKMQGDVTLNFEGKDVITLNAIKNKEQYGIKLSELYDKYISVENNNLKALCQKFGLDEADIPDKFEMIDVYELLNIDDEMVKHIEDTYFKVIKENIPAEAYTVEKNVAVKIDDADVVTNGYKLTITEEQAKTISIKLLETLKSDDKTLELITNKYNMLVKPYKAMEMSEEDELTKADFIKEIEKEIADLNNTSVRNAGTLELIAYGAKDNKAKININILNNGQSMTMFQIDMVKENSDKKAVVACIDDEGNKVMTSQIVENNEKQEANIELFAEDTKIKVNAVINENESSKVEMGIVNDDMTMELKIQDKVTTTGVTVEDFTTTNSVKLNDMTQPEINKVLQTIISNIQTVVPQKMQMIGVGM